MAALIDSVGSPARAETDDKAAARDHFAKGVAAFNEKRFADAATEFETAYRLSPAPIVLYNIGQVDVALGRAVEAVDAFEKYLADGRPSISPERESEVRAEIEKQKAQIGTVTVRTFPLGADVRVDGRLVGKSPLASLRLAAGKHTIEVQLARHVPQARDVEVTGRAQLDLEIKLNPVLVIVNEPPSRATDLQTPVAPSPVQGPTVSRDEPSPNWLRLSGFAVAGLGLAATVTGGVIAIVSAGSASDAKNRAANASAAPMPTQADLTAYDQAKTDFESAKSHNQLGWTIAGVGAAALVGGIVMIAISPKRETGAGVTGVSLAVTDQAGGFVLRGCW